MDKILTKNIAPSNEEIIIVKAKGLRVWDKKGKDYIDFSSQTLNLNLGQSHPLLISAAKRQLAKYSFLSSRFMSTPFLNLAKTLVRLAPKGLTKVNLKLTNGSDANESAFKRARKYHKKPTIVSFYFSHLGETSETISASGKHFKNRSYIGGSQCFAFFHPPHPDFIPSAKSIAEAERASLTELSELLEKRGDICGVIVEPIMVNAGVYVLSPSYLKSLRGLCTRCNVALIFDEVQTAFGWLGTFFAADKAGVTPDILTVGKALASGFPLAAVLMKEKYDVLEYGEDEFTYGGHPVSCAVALKNIEILEKMNLAETVLEKETFIKNLLYGLKNDYPFIKEVRGTGLIWVIDFDEKKSPRSASEIYDRAIKNGLILRKSKDGEGSALVIKPAVTVSFEELTEGFKRFRKAIE